MLLCQISIGTNFTIADERFLADVDCDCDTVLTKMHEEEGKACLVCFAGDLIKNPQNWFQLTGATVINLVAGSSED